MPRRIDHLVLCVRDLEAARRRFELFGFTVTPPGDHPFGTRNRLVLLEDNYLELLTIGDAGAIPSAATEGFNFGAHTQAFLAEREGGSMLALKSTDARADLRAFAARGLDTAALEFSRDAILPDGRTARVAFSLAVATGAALPGLAFFTCQHHQSRDLLSQPDYQHHANSARRIVEVVLSAADPPAHRHFFEPLLETEASVAPGVLSVGAADDRITLLSRDRLAERFPECTATRDVPRFAAYRVTVTGLGAIERQLQMSGVPYRSGHRAIVIAPDTAFGVAIEFSSAKDSEPCRP